MKDRTPTAVSARLCMEVVLASMAIDLALSRGCEANGNFLTVFITRRVPTAVSDFPS
jgi:hypothetical protein